METASNEAIKQAVIANMGLAFSLHEEGERLLAEQFGELAPVS